MLKIHSFFLSGHYRSVKTSEDAQNGGKAWLVGFGVRRFLEHTRCFGGFWLRIGQAS